jgi:hypothetical protein
LLFALHCPAQSEDVLGVCEDELGQGFWCLYNTKCCKGAQYVSHKAEAVEVDQTSALRMFRFVRNCNQRRKPGMSTESMKDLQELMPKLGAKFEFLPYTSPAVQELEAFLSGESDVVPHHSFDPEWAELVSLKCFVVLVQDSKTDDMRGTLPPFLTYALLNPDDLFAWRCLADHFAENCGYLVEDGNIEMAHEANLYFRSALRCMEESVRLGYSDDENILTWAVLFYLAYSRSDFFDASLDNPRCFSFHRDEAKVTQLPDEIWFEGKRAATRHSRDGGAHSAYHLRDHFSDEKLLALSQKYLQLVDTDNWGRSYMEGKIAERQARWGEALEKYLQAVKMTDAVAKSVHDVAAANCCIYRLYRSAQKALQLGALPPAEILAVLRQHPVSVLPKDQAKLPNPEGHPCGLGRALAMTPGFVRSRLAPPDAGSAGMYLDGSESQASHATQTLLQVQAESECDADPVVPREDTTKADVMAHILAAMVGCALRRSTCMDALYGAVDLLTDRGSELFDLQCARHLLDEYILINRTSRRITLKLWRPIPNEVVLDRGGRCVCVLCVCCVCCVCV